MKESPPPTPEDLPEGLKNKSMRELNIFALSNSYASEDDEKKEEELTDQQLQDGDGHGNFKTIQFWTKLCFSHPH